MFCGQRSINFYEGAFLMKSIHLLKFDGRGLLHCSQTLANYLPGFDPGLTALGISEGLLAGATLEALEKAYGQEGAALILRDAGVIRSEPISDDQALARMNARDPSKLPARATDDVSKNWHLDEVNVNPAWGQHWGGPDNITWGSIKVGQIDTGYTKHPVFGFGGNPWVDADAARTMFAPDANGGDPGPGNGIDPLADLFDGHGTRIGSVICGYDPAAPEAPYLGIAPKVPLVPVRIANTVLAGHAQKEMAAALNYLVDTAKVSVVNLSMGFLPHTPIKALKQAINHAYMSGVIFVCAAGQPLRQVVSPAHMRRTIAAAGTAIGSIPWGGSAYGPTVDWSAPAKQIYRANMQTGGVAVYGGGGDGTSYATAISTGAAALWMARHGDALSLKYPEGWQRVEAFKVAAKKTARLMPNQQPGSFGAGILNIADLLNFALPEPTSLEQEAPA